MFSFSSLDAARAHAAACYPRESCGLITGDYGAEQYHAVNNISPHSAQFRMAAETWLDLESAHGPIRGLVHSHPWDGAGPAPDYPSEADMRGQMATAVPWGIIVSTPEGCLTDITWFGDQCPVPPLTGPERYFRHGVTDCYSLIRDYYRIELGISLLEFPRDWEWWQRDGYDLYLDGFPKTGFRVVPADRAMPGDMFFASVGSTARRAGVVNHGGVYLGGRNHEILHHLSGTQPTDRDRLVKREPGERWMKHITHFLRHEERKL